MIYYLKVSTFFNADPEGAVHFYGTIRGNENKVVKEIRRRDTRENVVALAHAWVRTNGGGELIVSPVTEHC